MLQNICIIAFIIAIYFLLLFIKTKYLQKYKWNNIVLHIVGLVFFSIMGFSRYKLNDGEKITTLILVVMCGYFITEIYKDIRVFKDTE